MFIPSWCFWHWPYEVHSNLMPQFWLNWNRVEPPSSFLELFVVTLASVTRSNLHKSIVAILTGADPEIEEGGGG